MKKVEAIIKPYKFEEVRLALAEEGIAGMSVANVMGFGRQRGHTELYRGSEYSAGFLPKVKLEVVCRADQVPTVIQCICDNARSGKIGDGKIFVYAVEEAIQIRTGDTGEKAVA
ncbi:MAG: P-II family nitrogen regulator [Verrucomicrobiota bacterium]